MRCHYLNAMNILDFFILYLACGAPLGVYYFFENREQKNSNQFRLKTFFTFLFWIPFACRLLLEKNLRRSSPIMRQETFADEQTEAKISFYRNQFEIFLPASSVKISVFEFREIFDRYVGLSLALNSGKHTTVFTEEEKDFYQIAEHKNAELAFICLNRRNLRRLSFHQTSARQDFFQILNRLLETVPNKKKLGESAIEFVKLFDDLEALAALEKIPACLAQNDLNFAVKRLEKHLWKPELRKPLPASQTTFQLQTITAATATNSSSKD